MRKQLVELILSDHELKQFLRAEPLWFRKLSRNPHEVHSFQYAAKQYYHRTLPQKVDKISNSIEFASMMFQMLEAMNIKD